MEKKNLVANDPSHKPDLADTHTGGGNIDESFLPKNFGHIGKFGYMGPELLGSPVICIHFFHLN
jgi:hypothetical protein